jgi:hypothetical protein
VPGDRETRRVRHLAAGHEADARVRREPEQVEDPGADDLLDHGRGGRQDVQPRVLIPGARQPVGTDRRRQRATHDEAEVARPGRADDARIRGLREPLEHVGGVLAELWQLASQASAQLVPIDREAHRA